MKFNLSNIIKHHLTAAIGLFNVAAFAAPATLEQATWNTKVNVRNPPIAAVR